MRLFADENFPLPIVEVLRSHGHDIIWARTECPGLKDRALLERVERMVESSSRSTRTSGNSHSSGRFPLRRCGVILFRVHPAIPENLEPLVHAALRSDHSWVGHVSIVTMDGIEMVPVSGR